MTDDVCCICKDPFVILGTCSKMPGKHCLECCYAQTGGGTWVRITQEKRAAE